MGSRNFNGTTDKIDCGANTILQPTAAATLSCWVNISGQNNPYNQLLGWSDAPGGFHILVKGGGALAYYCTFVGGNAGKDPGNSSLTASTWYHVLATGDGSTGTVTGYVNGVNDGSATVGGPTTLHQGGNFWFGNDFGAPSRFYTGRIADGALWSTLLTQIEISALANGARPFMIRRAALRGWWPLGGLNSPEEELSGNAQNGTLTGTTSAFGPAIMLQTPRWPFNFLPPPPQVSVSYQRAQQILMTGP
jgi:hypothetical protein